MNEMKKLLYFHYTILKNDIFLKPQGILRKLEPQNNNKEKKKPFNY